jgi:signal transduction histidine kinase
MPLGTAAFLLTIAELNPVLRGWASYFGLAEVKRALEDLETQEQANMRAVCDDDGIVFGDRTRLVQVVGNLLGNGARYKPDGGCIDVELQREQDLVSLAIRDSGVGIAPAKIVGLFDLSTQVDRTSDLNSSGLGLGLTLVRTLAGRNPC